MTSVMALQVGGGDLPPELRGYRVARYAHGIAVFGPIPLRDMIALTTVWREEWGYDLVDARVSAAIGASLCVTDAAGAEAWRREVDAAAQRRAAGDAELEWVLGTDAGFSSMAIFRVLGSSAAALAHLSTRLYRTRSPAGDVPGDPDDLGRCIRLLDRFPGWRERLTEVAAAHPVWAPFVEAWPELEALYREEEPTGDAPRTLERMRELRAEAPR